MQGRASVTYDLHIDVSPSCDEIVDPHVFVGQGCEVQRAEASRAHGTNNNLALHEMSECFDVSRVGSRIQPNISVVVPAVDVFPRLEGHVR